MFRKALSDKNLKNVVDGLVDLAMYTREIPHVAFPKESLYKRGKVKQLKRISTSNKVTVSLLYANMDYELRGSVSYGHLYLALPFEPYPGSNAAGGKKNAVPIGMLGTSGRSLAHHIHMSSKFTLKRLGQKTKLADGPCSPIVFLPGKKQK